MIPDPRPITPRRAPSVALLLATESPFLDAVPQRNAVRIQARDAKVLAFADPRALTPLIASDAPPKEIVWMPAGTHAICAGTLDGETFSGNVVVDEQGFRVIAADFAQIKNSGQRIWLDCNHDDGAGVADVTGFSWDPARGIIAHLDWTPFGDEVYRGKKFTSFSPSFLANSKTGRLLGLVEGHAAGGLVNAPAFRAMPSLIAARLGGANPTKPAPGGNPDQNNMKDLLLKLLAALKITAPADATEDQLTVLFAKHMTDPVNAQSAAVTAVRDELKSLKDAKAAGDEVAVNAAKNASKVIADLEKKISEVEAIAAAGRAQVSSEPSLDEALAEYAAHDPCHVQATKANHARRAELARDRARIFAKSIRPHVRKDGLQSVMLHATKKTEDIAKVTAGRMKSLGQAAVLATNALGTLSGSLIAQTSLSLLKAKLPSLGIFTTDFSMENAKLNQQIITRVRGIPTVASWTTAGYVATAVTDIDVAVQIANHRYSQFAYNANELASTNRNLFEEQAEGTLYAIGKDLVDSILGLFTAANFYTTPGSPSANDGNGGHTIVTAANWGRTALINARTALVTRHVYPDMDKGFAIQNPTYYGQLAQDPAIVSLAVYQDKEIITQGQLPTISGILPVEYSDLPSNAINLTAIVGTSGAAVMATRLPYDYVDAQIGSNYGAVSQVTDADTGLSVMLTQYVNHDLGVSNYRVAVMTGYAVGDSTRAQLITSA